MNNRDSWMQQSRDTKMYELAAKAFAERLGKKLCFACWDLLVADINDAICLVHCHCRWYEDGKAP